MTREEFAKKIHWSSIVWLAGIANVMAMLPQLYSILTTRNVEGLNLTMFVTIFVIQLAFGAEGFFKRNTMLMTTMLLAAVVNIAIIGLTLHI